MVNDDLVDEMVEPAQEHNAEQEQQASDGSDNDDKPLLKTSGNTDASLSNDQVVVKQEDDRVSSTSLYCSLPLSRDVQSIIDTFPKSTDPERKKTRKLPCLYCERTFVADGLRQKHVERCHSVKQARRSSSRFQQGAVTTAGAAPTTTLQCQFCDAFQPPAGDDDLSDLFRHLVGEHADRYFACVACRERFVLKTHLDEHKEEAHGIKKEHVDAESVSLEETGAKSKGFNHKSKTKDFKQNDSQDHNSKDEKIIMEHKELRSKKTPIKSTKLGTKRSARLQNKESPSPNKNNSSASSTTSSSSSTSSKKKIKAKEVIADASEREIQKAATHENPYPTFDAFYRVKKITDHSIDNLRITSLTFSDVFDQAFYTRIKCNIADNLQNHIDGKLFKNEESESRISNFEKTQTEIKPAENNYGCEISLHAATPVATFLAPQLGDDPEAQIEYGSKASKKKPKPDEVHYKYFTRRKYQASIQEIKENRDLSKLDMWTQYVVKNRQQAIANTARSEKEKQDYKKGDEYRAKKQNEELNRILDRRGPFEDLKLEANKQAVLDGSVSREARVEVSCFLEDVLQRVFDLTQPEVLVPGVKTELTDSEMPAYLNLRRASLAGDTHVDRSDKITLICSSEETENFEAPQVSPRDKHALVELSGEWTRSRLFICAACGMRPANMRELMDHKNIVHQNVWCQHYEFVGKQGAYYKHLSIPGLGKMNFVEESPVVKSWTRSTARQCTKCKKVCNSLGELHRHILECGEDWSWMLIRKKCKYRPYGAKTRRKRRGLLKRHEPPKKENKEKKTYKRTERPREKPSDAETIQRMLANLPAKRATRTEMSLKDGFPKASKKVDVKKAKNQKLPKTRAEKLLQESSTLVKRKVLVASKCNPVNKVRKSVRNLNKVISSSLIDNNIMVRRKYKALQAKRATPARGGDMPQAPVELTEEQRAEEVKKKISLFKKVQKFRRSVIKKRTTKVSTSSGGSAEKLSPEASTSGHLRKVGDNWRKTRNSSNLTDNSSASSDRLAKSPKKKKLRANFGTKLLRTLSMRRKNKTDEETASTSSASTANAPEEKRKRFAGIRKVVKKLKVTNQKNKSDKKATKLVANEERVEVPSNEHFLEESTREDAIRTISDSQEIEKRDNDNRPSAIAPSLSSVSEINNKLVKNINEAQDTLVHQTSASDKDTTTQCAPNITITLADKDIDSMDNLCNTGNVPPSVPLLTTVNALNETLSVSINSASDTTQCQLSTDGITTPTCGGQLTSPLSLPSLSPLLGRSKSKLCKRAKGLNDCIAMLTSKLQCKSDTPATTVVHSPVTTIKETVSLLVQQQPETPVVVVSPHDTTTEEQNVVIPEETVSENLESAKEPEAAPPSPLPIKNSPPEAAIAPSMQTAITINDLSSPVIEQDKENIEMEQKTLMPVIKQGYDVADLIKCFEEIHPKEIRNGHLDHHAKADVINGLKGLTKKSTKPVVRKIGSNRKPPNKRTERTFVQEQLNVARLEQDLLLNDFERKMGSNRRSLPQRKTKKTFVDLKIPKINKKLSTIIEESQLLNDSIYVPKTCATDKSQVISNAPQTPHLVHAVQQNHLSTNVSEEKDELPVDLSFTRKPELLIEDDVPVDLSTKKNAVIDIILPGNDNVTDQKNTPYEVAPECPIETVNFNLKSNVPIENEAIVLETKVIPKPSPPQIETNSESEDELPLATLLKSIGPSVSNQDNSGECEKVIAIDKEVSNIPAGIVTPEKVKSQIQEAFLKKVKKTNKSDPQTQNKNNRKRKSEVASLHTYFNPVLEPIVISDEESAIRKEASKIDSAVVTSINPSSQLENKISIDQTLQYQNKVSFETPLIFSGESVVCTPDIGLSIEDMLMPTVVEEIDFEDVIPVVSISPSEAVKCNRNRDTGKTVEELMNESGLKNNGNHVNYDAIMIPAPKSKRGRKPKAKLPVLVTPEKKTVSVRQLINDFNCTINHLNFGNAINSVAKKECEVTESISAQPSEIKTSEVEETQSNVVSEQQSPNDIIAPPVETIKDPEIIAESDSKKESLAKKVTLKVRKVGRPKSRRTKMLEKSKKSVAKQSLAIEVENVIKTSNDPIEANVDTAEGTTTVTPEVAAEVPSLTSETSLEHCSNVDVVDGQEHRTPITITEENDKTPDLVVSEAAGVVEEKVENLEPAVEVTETPEGNKKFKSKTRKGKKTIADTIPLVPEPEETKQIINDVLVPVEEKVVDELQTTPIKIKGKRGRKPKRKFRAVPKVLSDPNTVENVTVTPEESISETPSIVPSPDITKTRSRKRKSDDDTSQPPVTIATEDTNLTTPSNAAENEPKKSIAIYDFDEDDDECTGDNSKENMDHLKTKTIKRSKRNGHSPSKVHVVEDENNGKLTKSVKLLTSKETQESTHEEINTPLKDVQNESFIQTPDLNDSALATKLVSRFKVKKGKNSKAKKIPIETIQEHLCEICNKQFGRLDSLNKHKRTLTHIAKLSEIEALEAEAKKKQNDLIENDSKEEDNETPETKSNIPEKQPVEEEEKNDDSEKAVEPSEEVEKIVDNITTKDIIEKLDETNILSPTSEFMRGRSHSDVTKSMLVTSPFSLKTNNDSLRLADIISDVLNKPVENMDNYSDVDKQCQQEPKRYKSLGERKSFDSDSVAYTPTQTFNISPASTLINKSSSDEFLKNQLSLLENIIEENKASFEYMDDTTVQSVQSIGSEKSDRCPSDMSLVSDIKADDSSRIISYSDERNFVKPNAQYEEISEDSMNNRNYEQERSRKTLNRDEELFLECCSLLKSSSEVSESKKSRATLVSDYNIKNRSDDTNNCGKQKDLDSRRLVTDDDFMSDSCPNTPIGDTFDDFSNSDSIKTDWSTKMNKREYEDISQSSVPHVGREENNFKPFNFKLDSKSDIDESSNSVDFRKNINAKFVGLIAEAMKGKSPKRKKQKERRKSDTTQTSIIDYAVQLTPKSSSNSTDNFTDLTNDSKKVMTKGAMKVFEGLKVSIPTDEIDMNQVLDCSPTSKRLEIEESAKIICKSKGLNFGNKLGMKVTKRRNTRTRKQGDYLTDSDKLPDVYDFEETQDNTDLFSSASKLNFRNGSKFGDKDIVPEKKEIKSTKKAKLAALIDDIIESESESNNQDLDLFGAEVQSVNSFSTETESSTSIKPSSIPTPQENITKKKCQIMGRIFKNAFKAKVEGSKESTPVDEGDALDKYIIGGPVEEIATPPPEKSPAPKERPKMSEKEMDLLFDKLLQGKDDQQPLKVNTQTPSNTSTPLASPIEKVESRNEPKSLSENYDSEIKESKETKTKKSPPKSVKNSRRRSRKHSESSDDEFNLSKAPKKRQIRKSKPRDNGINLDEEIKECMGVAGRKSQRKCTSGKQNVLIEYWSSDDSEFEAMLRLSMQESGTTEKIKESRQPKTTPASQPTPQLKSVANDDTHIDTDDVQNNKIERRKEILRSPNPFDGPVEDSLTEPPALDATTTISSAPPKNKTKRSSSNVKSRTDSRENKSPRAPKAKHPRVPRSPQDEETLAANRRKRAAVDTLYYWSSSSEDDTQNLIEVKSVRDEIDDEEDRPQHGWIVGDSPKKLVTLLAHAKGKKTNR